MSKIEFLQMVPALLFGISLAEIALFLGKATKGRQKIYWEHIVILLMSFETIIFNWYIFYDRLSNIEINYGNFLIQLLSPLMCFIYVANLLVKNDDPAVAPESFFNKHRKRIFISLSIFVAVNVCTVVYFNHYTQVGFFPLVPISIILINAFYNLKWLRIIAYAAKTIQIIIFCIYFK